MGLALCQTTWDPSLCALTASRIGRGSFLTDVISWRPWDPLYLEYLLVGGARAGEEGLNVIEFLLKEGKVDVNCRVRVGDSLETPLAAAVEQGNLEVIRFLLEQPGIDIALCGEYGRPPFLHLLRNSRSV
jgi:hypothetical protein